MKFSIITPTNLKNAFLSDLHKSILDQTYKDYEWVLYLNNKAKYMDIPHEIRSNPNVKIFESTEKNSKIGFIKNQAFNLASGDVLVEVDHDDMITPDCLEKLAKAFQDQSVDFVYSDDAVYQTNGEFIPYNPSLGWTYKKIPWKGQDLISMNTFPATSHSIGYIWYAPDHVRAWRAPFYKKIGGHNVELSVCDDHELMIRTYLHGNMYQIPEALYIYRVTGNNNWLDRNAEIQKTTVELFNHYAWDLAIRDAKKQGLLAVDIGGGLFPREGCLTIDQEGADITCDLNDGIPLPDNSVGVLNASHVLEHLRDPFKSMKEIHRVVCHGGWAFIEVPSTDGRGAWQDPTHVSFWNENSFHYYTRQSKAQYIRNSTIKFVEQKLDTIWWPENVAVTRAWLNPIKDGNRFPGVINI